MKSFLYILLLCFSTSVYSASYEQTITIDDDAEVSIETFASEGENLLLWLPSEFGLSSRQTATAEALNKLGIEVWIPDFHGAWFIPAGRYSLNKVDPEVIVLLLKKALSKNKTVYFLASGRSNVLALHGIRRYQLSGKDTHKVGGVIAINPRLYIRTPQGGEAAQYLPISTSSNVPMFLLQPKNSGGYWRTSKLAEKLSSGGSQVFILPLPNVRDGFHLSQDVQTAELALTTRLPKIIKQAMYQLEGVGGTPQTASTMIGDEVKPQSGSGSPIKPNPKKQKAPALILPALNGSNVNIQSLKDKVVLVNFWATWCPPCVEEIPSLQKLYHAKKAEGVEILAIDVGESHEQIHKFLKDKPVAFPVLLDEFAKALKTWSVHAFPTTLILDKQLRIRYAVFGAYDWNSPEIHKVINELLLEEN